MSSRNEKNEIQDGMVRIGLVQNRSVTMVWWRIEVTASFDETVAAAASFH